MACNIENITKKLNLLIDTTVKGKAASVEQDANGNFHIQWGPEFKVKTRDQAFMMGQQKIAAVNQKLQEEKFNPAKFGPYLVMDSTLSDRISLIKVEPTKLTRFLEWRNQAEEQERDLQEYLAEKEKEDNSHFFAEQGQDTEMLNVQNNENLTDIDKALQYADEVTDTYRQVFKDNPEEFLRNIAEQANSSASEAQGALAVAGEHLFDLALKMFPGEAIAPENLPPIIPKC